MNKKLLAGLTIGMTMMSSQAFAAVMTVTFSGADIMAYSTGENPGTIPVIGDGRVDFETSQSIGTYSRLNTNVSSASFNNWIDSLGSGEGISQFNLWLQDGNSNQAGIWGETIALTDAYSNAISPFASPGWTASVYTLDKWGASWIGRKLITYTANSPADYLRLNSTATFGFTADIMGNNGATGPTYQMWVGAGIAGKSDTGDNQLVSDDDAEYFQRAIAVNASPVPLPAALLLFGSGLVSLAGFSRRSKNTNG